MKTEKRRASRRNVRIPISCWKMEDGEATGSAQNYVTHDLSATGVAFEAKTFYAMHSTLSAELHLPGESRPLSLLLKVTRVESVLDKRHYRIGAEFQELGPDERRRLVQRLKESNIYSILQVALSANASDVHLTVGRPPVIRTRGRLASLKGAKLDEGHIKAMIYPLLSAQQIEWLETHKELDFAFNPDVEARFRVNLHYQKGFLEATLRNVPMHSKSFEELALPAQLMTKLCQQRDGLILIAGTTGSGKTTTMSSMVDFINKNLERVVITIENPIEFLHTGQKSIVKQRELGADTESYATALQHCLRQDPDVIVVGELMETEAVESALRAAETGHLVISTIHAPDTEQAVERLINMFPPEHAAHVCQQLSSSLVAVLYQTLVPGRVEDRVLASELMMCNHAIRNLIRERRTGQIHNCIQTGRDAGMYTLENRLEELRRQRRIEAEPVGKT